MRIVISLFVLLGSLWPVEAQWSSYPTPNIPRTGDGKPNLRAPTPHGGPHIGANLPSQLFEYSFTHECRCTGGISQRYLLLLCIDEASPHA